MEGSVTVAPGVRLLRGATLLGDDGLGIILGPGVVIARWAVVQSLGGFVRVGENSSIGDFSNLYGQGGLTIGDNVLLASGVRVMTEEHNTSGGGPISKLGSFATPTKIEDGAWLGANVVVLAGVTVGRGAICAAGAVVTRDVEPMSIVGGVPARHLAWR